MTAPPSRRRLLAVTIAVLLALSVLTAPAAAEDRVGGTVVVAEGETIDGDLNAVGERVVIRGTVTGDVNVATGSLIVEGTVGGSVKGAAGSARISGTVEGDVSIGAGSVVLAGQVGGTAELGADSITILPGTQIGGDLRYDAGTITGLENATVGGSVVRDNVEGPWQVPTVPDWAGTLYGLLANLAMGAVLLALLPRISRDVVGRIADSPLQSGGVGLVALVAIPILLVLVAITIVGIPVALLGLGVFLASLWIGVVYGSIAVGRGLLGLADREGTWLALLLGVTVVALVGLVPVVGGLVQFAVFLLGFGAVWRGVVGRFRRRRGL